MEEWRPVDGASRYAVSNHGQVMNTHTGRILKAIPGSYGHENICLVGDEGRINTFVHYLVAAAFCHGYQEGYAPRHIDGNPRNNNAWNLEWAPKRLGRKPVERW